MWPNALKKIETMSNKTIALGSDHAGFELKNEMIVHLIEQGFELIDMGPDSADSVDWKNKNRTKLAVLTNPQAQP
jgi:ribose 5-phosphate isomerase B